MSTIRELTADEVYMISQIGYAFSAETGDPDTFGFDGTEFETFWGHLIRCGYAVIFAEFYDDALPAGAIGAIKAPNDKDGLLGVQEAFWFVHKEYRRRGGVRLIARLEEWAREQGVVRLSLCHLAHMNADALGALYKSLGYRPIEVHYMKRLDHGTA